MDSVSTSRGSGRGFLYYAGSAGLLTVMLIESAAVIGRHVGLPVLGALEIAQAAIVPATCAAMLIAGLRGAHAAVHMITERLPEGVRRTVDRGSSALAGLYFSALSVGSIWLADEYWNSFEQTEVLHIPFRPLRALVAVAFVAIAVAFFTHAIRPRAKS
jgi:TRAP-type C4-dicarboxylate transport system permease small subunit